MAYDPAKHHRRSIRLRGYGYSQPGAYFVTICTQNNEYLFGDVVDGGMVLNDAGQMVQGAWDELPANYPGIETDAFIIMPNHVHGIITIQPPDAKSPLSPVGAGPRACPPLRPPREQPPPTGPPSRPRHPPPPAGQPQGVAPTTIMSLPDVVHRFKTLTTKRYTDAVKHTGWRPFPGRLWQRNYWDHIVRNERELHHIREYIINNPAKWESDRLYGSPSKSSPMVRERASKYAEEAWMV